MVKAFFYFRKFIFQLNTFLFFRSPLAGHEAVRVSTRQADSGSSVQGEGERCTSPTRSPVLAIQTWFSELIRLLHRPPWEILVRQDLLSQLQGKIWHPRPEIWKLCVWPIQGHRFWLLGFLLRFRRISLVPELPPLGSCTLPNGRSLSLGV